MTVLQVKNNLTKGESNSFSNNLKHVTAHMCTYVGKIEKR